MTTITTTHKVYFAPIGGFGTTVFAPASIVSVGATINLPAEDGGRLITLGIGHQVTGEDSPETVTIVTDRRVYVAPIGGWGVTVFAPAAIVSAGAIMTLPDAEAAGLVNMGMTS